MAATVTTEARGKGSRAIATAKIETCPACHSELAKGIMREFAKAKDAGDPRTCPECPGRAPQTRADRRQARVAAAVRDAAAEERAPRPRLKATPVNLATAAALKAVIADGETMNAEYEAATAKGKLDGAKLGSWCSEHVRWTSDCGCEPKPDTAIRATVKQTGGPRLAQGGLHDLVLAFVRDRADEDWSPGGIGRAVGRSSGAIAKSLARHAAAGAIAQTSAHPIRYRAIGVALGEQEQVDA